MKSPIAIPFTLDTNSNSMKHPHVCSVPALLDIDPFAPLEFYYPCQDMWWDLSDLSSSEDDHFDSDLDVSFTSSFYQFSPDPEFTEEDEEKDDVNGEEDDEKDEEDDVKNGEEVVLTSSDADGVPSDQFIDQIVCVISHTCPASKYKKRKLAIRRRRKRRQRKRSITENIEPELHALWTNINTVGDLFAPSAAVSKPLPPSSLPEVNLAKVNKQMLKRLPDVVQAPIHSCSYDPNFYEENLRTFHGDFMTAYWKEKPFGTLPAIITNLGLVPPPTDACYGYVWTDEGWRVKAERPRVPDRGGRRGGGYDGGGRVGEADHRGGKRNWK